MNKKFAQRFRHAVNGGTPDSLARFPVYLTYQGVDRTPQISGISLHKDIPHQTSASSYHYSHDDGTHESWLIGSWNLLMPCKSGNLIHGEFTLSSVQYTAPLSMEAIRFSVEPIAGLLRSRAA